MLTFRLLANKNIAYEAKDQLLRYVAECGFTITGIFRTSYVYYTTHVLHGDWTILAVKSTHRIADPSREIAGMSFFPQ